MSRLLVATHNPGKLAEFRRLLDGLNAEGISRVLGITRAQARIGLLHARLAMRLRLFDRMRVATV